VCIAKGATVTVAEGEGTDEAGAVEGEGALVISGGTLLVSGTMLEEPSNLATLTQEGGRLTGAGTLRVSKSLTWSGGEMSGKGATVVNATASGTLNPYHSGAVHLTGGRTLVNEKTTVLSPGHLALTEGSVLKNTGTFEANSTDSC